MTANEKRRAFPGAFIGSFETDCEIRLDVGRACSIVIWASSQVIANWTEEHGPTEGFQRELKLTPEETLDMIEGLVARYNFMAAELNQRAARIRIQPPLLILDPDQPAHPKPPQTSPR